MYTYYLVSSSVVNCCNDLFMNCITLKLAVHIANIIWSTPVQREVLYTYNKVGVRLFLLNAWAWTPHCASPKLIPLLSTHHMENNRMHYVCAHTTSSALGLL